MYTPVIDNNFIWATGLFEGEGYFDTHGTTRRLNLTSTDEDVVIRFMEAVGCGNITERSTQKEHHKRQFMWRAGRRELTLPLIHAMYPYLGERRKEQADAFIACFTDYPWQRQ